MSRPRSRLSQSIGSSTEATGEEIRRTLARQELAAKLNANPADVLLSIVAVLKREKVTALEVAGATVEAARGRRPHTDAELEAGISKVLDGLETLASSERSYEVALHNRRGYRAIIDGSRVISHRLEELANPTPKTDRAHAELAKAVEVPPQPVLSAEELDELLGELSALRYVLPRKPFGPDYPLLDEVLNGFVAEVGGESVRVKQLEKAADLMILPQDLRGVSPAERRAWGHLRGHMVIAANWAVKREHSEVPARERQGRAGEMAKAIETYRSVDRGAEVETGSVRGL